MAYATEQPADVTQQMPYESMPQAPTEDVWFKSEMWKALSKILDDPTASTQLTDFALWIANSNSMKLTFFNERDAEMMHHLFEASVCRLIRSLPRKELTTVLFATIDQARMLFYANVKRSVGTSQLKMNERLSILSQMRLEMGGGGGSPNIAMQPAKKVGFVKRLFGMG